MDLLPKLLIIAFVGIYHVSSVAESSSDEIRNRKILQTYVIHMAKFQMPSCFGDHSTWYKSSLNVVSKSAEILYRYDTVVHGFSALLTPQNAEELAGQHGVISVMPETRYELHTTRTPEFLGLTDHSEPYGESTSAGVIVGVLDTGVWPGSRSLDDTGFGAVPSRWKGLCETGSNSNSSACNRRLIGARFFSKGYEAAMGPIDDTKESKSWTDDDGHGTHTSTTVAGARVEGASLLGYASGTARGMALGATLAVYKVCWVGGCFSSDILAAIDKAVEDGVDILSISLGGGMGNYNKDSVAIGAFAAMEKGILVSCSAGNSGPNSHTLSNVAPWLVTVGAGAIDRDFPAIVKLGDGRNFFGTSLYSGSAVLSGMLPLVYAGKVSNMTNGNLCVAGSLDPQQVAGKLVLCDRGLTARVLKGMVVKNAGGAGMILANGAANGEELVADAHLIPASAIGERNGVQIKEYVASSPTPTATIVFEGTKLGVHPSPVVAAFSSRGPNSITPGILKPDLIAPGLNILAGWSGAVGPTGIAADERRVAFNIISGTSMSCPHVSGIAALVKAAHPDWSPAAIQSALMTTAYTTSKNGSERIKDSSTSSSATPFDMGSGHVDPTRAVDPGLLYDRTAEDYLHFLCALNYTPEQLSMFSKRDVTCDARDAYSVGDLNYPSFALSLSSGSDRIINRFNRTVTNVGPPATYAVSVEETAGIEVSVRPESLTFTELNERKTYTVTITASSMPAKTTSFASLVWSGGNRTVSSPIAVTWD